MKNKNILLGLIILAFVFTGSSCDILGEIFTVPSWAQGNWTLSSTGVQAKAAEITSKEFIPSVLLSMLPGIERKSVTWVTSDEVNFDLIGVKKGNNSKEIVVSYLAASVKLYKL